jgi:hypothetical protein
MEKIDQELYVMMECYEHLRPMNEQAKDRTLNWLTQRLQQDHRERDAVAKPTAGG